MGPLTSFRIGRNDKMTVTIFHQILMMTIIFYELGVQPPIRLGLVLFCFEAASRQRKT